MAGIGETVHERTVGLDRSGTGRVDRRLERILSLLTRLTHALVLALAVVVLVATIVLVIAGTYGILHNGDDFDFGGIRGGGGGNSDIIRVGGLLS